MEHFRHESNFGCFVRIVVTELNDQIEDSALPNGVVRSKNDCFPLEERITGRRGLNAILSNIVMHLLQVFQKTSLRVGTHVVLKGFWLNVQTNQAK